MRTIATAIVGLIALVAASACSSEPTPAPTQPAAATSTTTDTGSATTTEPAATTEPTTADTTTSTTSATSTTSTTSATTTTSTTTTTAATTTTTTEPPEPAADVAVMPMRGFVLDESTTGKDLFDRLSEQENDCIKEALTEAVYDFMLGMSLMAAGGDAAAAAPLFACLAPENVALLGVAFLSARVGGHTDESLACMSDLALAHPGLIYARLGLEWTGEDTYQEAETGSIVQGFYDCMTEDERAAALKNLYASIDAASPLTGEDLVALLPESEAACVRDTLSEEDYGALLSATPLRAAGLGVSAAECLSLDSVAAFFVSATDAGIGGLSDESAACLDDFVRANPAYVPLFASYLGDESSPVSAAEFMEVGQGVEALACLNELGGIDEFMAALWG